MVSLIDLPEEILLHIHYLSLSPFLPLSHPTLYQTLHHAPKSYIARYLLRLYAAFDHHEILVRAVKHPVCDVAVAKEMRRSWDVRRGYLEPISVRKSKRRKMDHGNGDSEGEKGDAKAEEEEEEEAKAPPPPSRPALKCSELPRRLFRGEASVYAPIPDLLEYLMDTYSPSPNSHKGYPLCRAVLTSNTALIRYLLDRHADPALERALPVRIATQMGRLDLVKLLVEPSPSIAVHEVALVKDADDNKPASDTTPKRKGIVTPSPSSSAKKRKYGDRVNIGPELVELAMRNGQEHIVRYFVHDKGVMPPLRSIMKLGGADQPIDVKLRAKKKVLSNRTVKRTRMP